MTEPWHITTTNDVNYELKANFYIGKVHQLRGAYWKFEFGDQPTRKFIT